MFICLDCMKKKKIEVPFWERPSYGPCEVCENYGTCYDLQLPIEEKKD